MISSLRILLDRGKLVPRSAINWLLAVDRFGVASDAAERWARCHELALDVRTTDRGDALQNALDAAMRRSRSQQEQPRWIPGGAAAGSACDAFNAVASDTTTGHCVPSADLAGDADLIGDGDNDLTACLVKCVPDGGAGDCTTSGAVCADFTDTDPSDGVPGAGLFVCLPAP